MPILTIWISEDPPSKANSYEIIKRPTVDKRTGNVLMRASLKKSTMARDFEESVAWQARERIAQTGFPTIDGDAVLQIDWYRDNRRRRDNDNIVKAIQDALTDAGVWQDDSQVATLIVNRFWGQDTTEPHLAITVGPRQAGVIAVLSTLWERAVRFLHPAPFSRRHWIQQEAAEQAFGPAGTPVLRTHCRRCCIGIGVNLHEREIWLAPVSRGGRVVDLEIVCGECAREDGLPPELQIFGEADLVEQPWPKLEKTIKARRQEMLRDYACNRSRARAV